MRRKMSWRVVILLSVVSSIVGAVQRPTNPGFANVWKKVSDYGLLRKLAAQTSQVGAASWYGKRFQGRITASGEPYDMNDLTAAHATLPIGTYVRITSLANGRKVVVRVSDRGPFTKSRIIDVSLNAARVLGFEKQGVQQVRLDVVAR